MSVTFFTLPRPFIGRIGDLQQLAIRSWQTAVPGCEVLLLGRGAGIMEAAAALCARHVPDVATNSEGTELIGEAFRLGHQQARHEWLCEISADIVLGGDFAPALRALEGIERPFVVGQRWDLEPGAEPDTAVLHPPCGVDYFLYRRGTVPASDIPPFAVGRTVYDNWLVWAAMERWGLQVIDATAAITAIHMNHGRPKYGNLAALLASDEKAENTRLFYASGATHPYGITSAPFVMTAAGKIERRAPCPG